MVRMGVTTQTQTQLRLDKHVLEGFVSKSMELKWIKPRTRKTSYLNNTKPLFPIYISTDPRHVDPHRLRDLFTDCNHSTRKIRTRPEPVDIHKLRIALSHSAVLVSVFCNPHYVNAVPAVSSIADFFTPVSPSRDQLVGFGRAVSDYGLTASIYDVVVIPSLQRMGIGQMIVKKIVRYTIYPLADAYSILMLVRIRSLDHMAKGMLTNRDIYDIAALCSENERLFFKACGFGDDILGSTTMMYTRTARLTTQEGE